MRAVSHIILFFIFSSLQSLTLLAQDFDKDGIVDSIDLDDDNDGIPDEEEQICPAFSETPYSVTSQVYWYENIHTKDLLLTTQKVTTKPNGLVFQNIELLRFIFKNPIVLNGVKIGDLRLLNSGDTFEIQGSSDGKYWDSLSSHTVDRAQDSYQNNNQSTYKYYRILILDGGNTGKTFGEVSLLYGDFICDIDSDGFPNHQDLDSDNDGCPDIQENIGLEGSTVTDHPNFTGVGSNGLADFLETSTDAGILKEEVKPYYLISSFDCQDYDQDGILDVSDQDDDNDGISDIEEYKYCQNNIILDNIIVVDNRLTGLYDNILIEGNTHNASINNPNGYELTFILPEPVNLQSISFEMEDNNNDFFEVHHSFDNKNWTKPTLEPTRIIQSSNNKYEYNLDLRHQPSALFLKLKYVGSSSSLNLDLLELKMSSSPCDTDKDGQLNGQDWDMDGDGCLDIVEAGIVKIDQIEISEHPLFEGYTENGIATFLNTAENTMENRPELSLFAAHKTKTNGCIDTDGDKIGDINDLDDDNDGIRDSDEKTFCDITESVNDGLWNIKYWLTDVHSGHSVLPITLDGLGDISYFTEVDEYGLPKHDVTPTLEGKRKAFSTFEEDYVPAAELFEASGYIFFPSNLNGSEIELRMKLNGGVVAAMWVISSDLNPANWIDPDRDGEPLLDMDKTLGKSSPIGAANAGRPFRQVAPSEVFDRESVQEWTATITVEHTGHFYKQYWKDEKAWHSLKPMEYKIKGEDTWLPVQSGWVSSTNPYISCHAADYDEDGKPNALDLDSDGDGCPDALEAGHYMRYGKDSTLLSDFGFNGLGNIVEINDGLNTSVNYKIDSVNQQPSFLDSLANDCNDCVISIDPIEGNSVYCEADTLRLSTSGARSYKWYSPSNKLLSEDSVLVLPDLKLGDLGNYKLVAYDSPVCSMILNKPITIGRSAAPKPIVETKICAGEPINLTVKGDVNAYYLWTNSDGLRLEGRDQIIQTDSFETNTFEVQLYMEPQFGCPGYGSLKVTIGAQPILDKPKDQTFCKGDTATLTLSNVKNVIWTGPNNFFDNRPTLELADLDTIQSGYYKYYIQTSEGCQIIDSAKVEVSDYENISLTPTYLNCDDSTIQFSANTSERSLEWIVNGKVKKTAKSTIEVDGKQGYYTVQVKTKEGCFKSAPYEYQASKPIDPTIEISQSECDNNTGSIQIIDVDPRLQIDWFDIDGVDNIKERSKLSAGTYRVDLSIDNCLETREFTIVNECEPTIFSNTIKSSCAVADLNILQEIQFGNLDSTERHLLQEAYHQHQFDLPKDILIKYTLPAESKVSFVAFTTNNDSIDFKIQQLNLLELNKKTIIFDYPISQLGNIDIELLVESDAEKFANTHFKDSIFIGCRQPEYNTSALEELTIETLALDSIVSIDSINRISHTAYTRTISLPCGANKVYTYTYSFKIKPTFELSGNTEYNCLQDDKITIEASDPNLTYSWNSNAPIIEASNNFIELQTTSEAIWIEAIGTNLMNCSDTKRIDLEEIQGANFQIVGNATLCPTAPLNLKTNSTRSVQWVLPNTTDTLHSKLIHIDSTLSSHEGWYIASIPVCGLKDSILISIADTCSTTDDGNTDDGNTDDGNTDDGNTDDGNTDNGNTDNGNTDNENTDNGNTDNENTDDGNTDDGNTDDGNTDNGNTDNGNTDNGNTDDGNTDDGNTDDGNTDDGNTNDGNTNDGNTDDGNTNDGNTDDGNTNDGNASEKPYGNSINTSKIHLDTIYAVIEANGTSSFCLFKDRPQKNYSYIDEVGYSENSPMIEDQSKFCMSYKGLKNKQEKTFVLCSDSGNCDTLIVILESIPIIHLNNDTISTTKSTVSIYPFLNDTISSNASLEIIKKFNTFNLEVNDDLFTVSTGDNCGMQDTLTYILREDDLVDTSMLIVNKECQKIIIYTGISTNGDGINDYFIIDGIEHYPKNKLTIFNKVGTNVFSQDGYSNESPWDGTLNGRLQPSGTYFYVLKLNDANDTIYAGYIQLN